MLSPSRPFSRSLSVWPLSSLHSPFYHQAHGSVIWSNGRESSSMLLAGLWPERLSYSRIFSRFFKASSRHWGLHRRDSQKPLCGLVTRAKHVRFRVQCGSVQFIESHGNAKITVGGSHGLIPVRLTSEVTIQTCEKKWFWVERLIGRCSVAEIRSTLSMSNQSTGGKDSIPFALTYFLDKIENLKPKKFISVLSLMENRAKISLTWPGWAMKTELKKFGFQPLRKWTKEIQHLLAASQCISSNLEVRKSATILL